VATFVELPRETTSGLPGSSPSVSPAAFWETIRSDLYRYHARVDARTFLKSYLRTYPFRFTFWLRAAMHFRSRPGLLAKFAYYFCRFRREHYTIKYGYQILEGTQIGPGLYLGHLGALVINHQARIGRNVNIAVGTTIGQTNRGKRQGAPTIGDRVWIGTNAVIVGRVTIGAGSLIGPGAYVNFDVPPNSVLIGNPAQIVADTGTAGYVENILDSSI
jgi:serine O-acetyltransferase